MPAITVPLRRAGSRHGLHILPVTLDGRGPFDFILDTGAQLPLVDPALADELGLQRDGSDEAHGAGGAVTIHYAKVGQLAVGALARRNVQLAVSAEIERIAQAVRAPLRGAIGYGWLEAFQLRLDARASTLQLAQDGPVSASRVPFRLAHPERPLVLLDVAVDGRPAVFALDTGASGTCISEELARRLGLELSAPTKITGGGGQVPAKVSRLGRLEVAGARVEGLRVVVAGFVEQLASIVGAELDGILGNDVLDEHVLVLDYPGSWLALE
jgi:predicted aspartyl protease